MYIFLLFIYIYKIYLNVDLLIAIIYIFIDFYFMLCAIYLMKTTLTLFLLQSLNSKRAKVSHNKSTHGHVDTCCFFLLLIHCRQCANCDMSHVCSLHITQAVGTKECRHDTDAFCPFCCKIRKFRDCIFFLHFGAYLLRKLRTCTTFVERRRELIYTRQFNKCIIKCAVIIFLKMT